MIEYVNRNLVMLALLTVKIVQVVLIGIWRSLHLFLAVLCHTMIDMSNSR